MLSLIANADDYRDVVSSRTTYKKLQERDRNCKEIHVPTEVILRGCFCRIDNDQDPEQLVCVYTGNEVISGEGITLGTSSNVNSPQQDVADDQLSSNDWELNA